MRQEGPRERRLPAPPLPRSRGTARSLVRKSLTLLSPKALEVPRPARMVRTTADLHTRASGGEHGHVCTAYSTTNLAARRPDSSGAAKLHGSLQIPADASGIVGFVPGSGSSRFSPPNRYMAGVLYNAGLG